VNKSKLVFGNARYRRGRFSWRKTTMVLQYDDNGRQNSIVVGVLNLPSNDAYLSINGIGLRIAGGRSNDFVAITGVAVERKQIHWIVWNQKHVIVAHHDHHLILSYDPSTEELVVVTDPVTRDNFIRNIGQQTLPCPGVVTYEALLVRQQQQEKEELQRRRSVTTTTTSTASSAFVPRIIDPRLLRLRGLEHGTKIVPGTYRDDNGDDAPPGATVPRTNQTTTTTTTSVTTLVDGIEMVYPSIPIFATDRGSSSSLATGASFPPRSRIRHVAHSGTKSFLRALSPADRTRWFTTADDDDFCPNARAVEQILIASYESSITTLLADLDLAFFFLLHIHCYSSWIHWRDLTVLLLRAHRPEVGTTLLAQLQHVETEIWDEYDADGMLAMALRQYQGAPDPYAWQTLLDKTLPRVSGTSATNDDDDNVDPKDDPMMASSSNRMYDNDDDDDDPPVIVENVPDHLPPLVASVTDPLIRQRYPILAAAVLETEDILMTCARALDEAKDVSLVREAAAYLEQVEALRFC
jgi:hypothetical protein